MKGLLVLLWCGLRKISCRNFQRVVDCGWLMVGLRPACEGLLFLESFRYEMLISTS
jgi:hypothetical protein